MFRSANHSCFGLLNNNKRKSVTGENARKRENGRGAGEETRGREGRVREQSSAAVEERKKDS